MVLCRCSGADPLPEAEAEKHQPIQVAALRGAGAVSGWWGCGLGCVAWLDRPCPGQPWARAKRRVADGVAGLSWKGPGGFEPWLCFLKALLPSQLLGFPGALQPSQPLPHQPLPGITALYTACCSRTVSLNKWAPHYPHEGPGKCLPRKPRWVRWGAERGQARGWCPPWGLTFLLTQSMWVGLQGQLHLRCGPKGSPTPRYRVF